MSTLVSPFECPVCFQSYADVDPTTFTCGHSCCLEDAQSMLKCHLCQVELNKRSLVVNFTLRDAAKFDRERENHVHQESVKISLLVDSLRNDLSVAIVASEVYNSKRTTEPTVSVPGVISDDSHLENNDGDDDDNVMNTSKATFSSAAGTTSVNTTRDVDPDALKTYKVRTYSAEGGFETSTNVRKIFEKSRPFRGFFPPNFMATQRDERQATFWRDVLIEIVNEHAKDRTVRFIVQTKDEMSGLIIDVLDLKLCPLSLVHKSFLKKPDESLEGVDRGQFPLLLLRYNYATDAMMNNPVFLKEIENELLVRIKTTYFNASEEAILATRDYLQQKELLLAQGYVTQFGRENTRVFRPSFVVPMAIEESEMKKEEGCCNVEGCSNPGWAICAKCKSAQYCSREHQVEHWKKVHKHVCGKTHEEVAAMSSSADDSPSVVIPMRSMGDVRGWGNSVNITMNNASGKSRTFGSTDIARNIHGDKKFLIKVQRAIDPFPLRISTTGAINIYDETRSFQCVLDISLKTQYDVVWNAVEKNGIPNFERIGIHDNLKAYMYAK